MHRRLLIAGVFALTGYPASAKADDIEVGPEPRALTVAEEPRAEPRHPSVGFEIRFGTGASFPVVPRPLASSLRDAGHDPISPVMPRLDTYLGLVAGRFSLGLDLGTSLDAGPTDDHRRMTSRAFAVAGIRAYAGPRFGITPTLGLGFKTQRLCFRRPGNGAADASATAFEQLVQQPGPNTCLRSSGPALRIGVAFDYDLLLPEADGTVAGFRFRLEPGIEIPLQGSTWEGGHPALDSFRGPSGPPLDAFLAASVGLLIGR